MNLTCTHPDRWIEPSSPAVARTRSTLHARYIDYLASRRPTTWTQRPPWRAPSLTGALAVTGVGVLWGTAIGFCIGGAAGLCLYIIGAIWGAPIGAVIGFLIAWPAVAAVVLVLLVRHRPLLDVERTGRDIAASLGVLVELLVVLALGVPAVAGADDAGLEALLVGGFILVPALVIAGAASFLLRFAARDLLRTWARAWGWKAVR